MKKSWIFSILGLLMALVGLDIVYDITHFKIQKYELKSKKIKKPYHFVVLADLHGQSYGKDNDKLLRAIDDINPEAIYIAGDMITAMPDMDFSQTLRFLKKISAKYPIYYGSGNHEYRMRIDHQKYGNMSEKYEKALKQMGIIRLYTGYYETERSDVTAYGLEIDRRFYRKWETPVMPEDYSVQKLGEISQDSLSILIAHNPEYFDNYAHTGADIVLSGHLHGGIANLPILGGVITPKFRLFPKYDGGLFKKNNSTMILSRGLGWHTIPVRFLNPGELVDVMVVPEK